MKKPYFMKCQYCGRYPNPDRTDCRGCGAPLECYEENKDDERFNPASGGVSFRATAGERVTIDPTPGINFAVNINRNAMSIEKFDAAIRNWLGA